MQVILDRILAKDPKQNIAYKSDKFVEIDVQLLRTSKKNGLRL